MKTVPSGKFDFCMNGALAVYGMTIVGMPAPAMVGRSERLMIALPVVEEPPVVTKELDESLVAELLDVVSVAVERSGAFVRICA